MATEDDKPQTTFATEKEDKELLTEVSGIPITKLPVAEMNQVEPLHNDIEDRYESTNGKKNTKTDSSNLNKDEYGGSVLEESSIDSVEATSDHSAEVNNVRKGVNTEDGGTGNKFNTTTASFERDPYDTSFPTKEEESSKIASTPENKKLDPEILHFDASVATEITEKEDNSDLSQSTSKQIMCQSDHIEETEGNVQIAEIQPASPVITLTTTEASAATAGPGKMEYEVKSTEDTTKDSDEDVSISSYSEYPNKEDDKEKENAASNKEQLSETENSSYDEPESIREVNIVSMSEENQPKEIHGDNIEEKMHQKDEVSSEEHNFTSQGSHSTESKSGEDLQVENIISMCPKEEADYMNNQEIRGNTSENVATDLEEDQSNGRTTESAKENNSFQEFQMITKANKAVDEANNPELLPIKDLSTVASDEIPEAIITEAAKDVIWEQKLVPVSKESEEIRKRNDELADATNFQSSEENSNNSQAIKEVDCSVDSINILRMPKEEEKRLEEVQVDDKSDIDSHEKPLESNNISYTGLSREEVGNVNIGNILGQALQPQTIEQEHADKESITTESSNLTENEAAGKARSEEVYNSQEQGVKELPKSGEIQTVKCDSANKIKEESCKGITTVPKCESADAVNETNVGLDQTSSAAKVIDNLEALPSVMFPKQEDCKTLNILGNRKDEGTDTHADIVNETSTASFATTLDGAFLQKEENKAPASEFRDSLVEENNGMEASEAEGKEHACEVDYPATIKFENKMELPVEKKTGDEKSLNSYDTSKDGEQLALSQPLEIGNQPNKEDKKNEETTELFTRPDEVLLSELDTENPQVFAKEKEAELEINEVKLEGGRTENGENIQIEESNRIQETPLNDHSIEKIGNKYRSAEDSSCCSPREEIHQKSNREDDLEPEEDPGVKAGGIFVATNNTSSSTKFEEPKTSDATESFMKEMPTEEKFVERPSQVSTADETVKYSTAEEGKEKLNISDTTTYDEFKQVDPGVKADDTTNNASQRTKKQTSDEEQGAEGLHQKAEEILNNHPPEEKKERNVIDTKTRDEMKPEGDTGLNADEISKTIYDGSNSTKFEEAEMNEATQIFIGHLLSIEKVDDGPRQIAEETENYSLAEEGKEERSDKDTTAADQLKPETHTGEKFEELEAIGATQRLQTPLPSEDQVAEGPFQASIAEEVVNYSTAEERKEEKDTIDTTGDELKPEVDSEVKVDEISATTSNAIQRMKFEGTEIFEATQSYRKQSPTKDEGVEEPCQVSTAQEIVNYNPAAEDRERNVKDTEIEKDVHPESVPRIKPDEISEAINNVSVSTMVKEQIQYQVSFLW
ncbi:hypothetical protein ACH5RR_014462 [Cinchona calisaya]|uniref:Uncharacterized protein n=1 Tax=Cinchona calisaya TaxID=153742 RepID=A0ABD3A6B3_9GENT